MSGKMTGRSDLETMEKLFEAQTSMTRQFVEQLTIFNENQKQILKAEEDQRKVLDQILGKFQNGFRSEIIKAIESNGSKTTDIIKEEIAEEISKLLEAFKNQNSFMDRFYKILAFISSIIAAVLAILQFVK